MEWTLKDSPVPPHAIPPMNALYLYGCRQASNPRMEWETDVDFAGIQELLAKHNARDGVAYLSAVHFLIRAVGVALKKHPEFNRRILRKKVYEYKNANVLLGMQHPVEKRAELMLLKNVDKRSCEEIAGEIWQVYSSAIRGEFRYEADGRRMQRTPAFLHAPLVRFFLHALNNWNLPATPYTERQRSSPVLVNYLSFPDAPPLNGYRASHLPADSYTLNVTLGAPQDRPAVNDRGEVVVKRLAHLFVQADHRLVDAIQLGMFVRTLRDLLQNPSQLQEAADENPDEQAAVEPPSTPPVRHQLNGHTSRINQQPLQNK